MNSFQPSFDEITSLIKLQSTPTATTLVDPLKRTTYAILGPNADREDIIEDAMSSNVLHPEGRFEEEHCYNGKTIVPVNGDLFAVVADPDEDPDDVAFRLRGSKQVPTHKVGEIVNQLKQGSSRKNARDRLRVKYYERKTGEKAPKGALQSLKVQYLHRDENFQIVNDNGYIHFSCFRRFASSKMKENFYNLAEAVLAKEEDPDRLIEKIKQMMSLRFYFE